MTAPENEALASPFKEGIDNIEAMNAELPSKNMFLTPKKNKPKIAKKVICRAKRPHNDIDISNQASMKSHNASVEEKHMISVCVTQPCLLSHWMDYKHSIAKGGSIAIVLANNTHVVPQGFSLKQSSFKGKNYTHGIAYYDAPEQEDPRLCKDYVTDIFQQFYHAEVCRRPIGPTYVVGPWTHEYRKKKRCRFLITEKL